MGLWTTLARDRVDETVSLWKERCLLGSGSLLWPDEEVWTPPNVVALHDRFRSQPMYDVPGGFDDKFSQQLEGADLGVRHLASETLVIYYLFVAWLMGGDAKRGSIKRPLEALGESLPETEPVHSALDQGLGNPGSGWQYNRPAEFGLLLDVMAAWKVDLDDARRHELLDRPFEMSAWIDSLPAASGRQMRHVLLHLLFPEQFERIASSGHKQTIALAFRGLVKDPPDDQDELLLAIRQRLQKLLAERHPELAADDHFDFYREPVESSWRGGDPENLSALRFKKQIVLYGPPGTSKTYEAKELAHGVLRQHALELWGAARVFADSVALEAAFDTNIHRLQLHPAYSYEDFVRGLAIDESGKTIYRKGYLLRLLDRIDNERREQGDEALPHVLILDELNRVDLSRILGEAFSALENRGEKIELPGADDASADAEPMAMQLPDDLYVIGTMNLIDQSVEQIDFALRRRFLWRESRFNPDTLLAIVESDWRASGQRTPWERIEPDMRLLAATATVLNERIAEMPTLGEQYEVGHTYYKDIVPLLAKYMPPKRASTAKGFLWSGGSPSPALVDLWELALKPLLSEYLAGIEATERQEALVALRAAFLARPS